MATGEGLCLVDSIAPRVNNQVLKEG